MSIYSHLPLAEKAGALSEMRKVAAELYSTPRSDTNVIEQALKWTQKADALEAEILEPAARAILASFFGGPQFGIEADSITVMSHKEQKTQQWSQALHYAKVAYQTAGLI